MADIKILGNVFNGVSKLNLQNASGGGTTEFSAGGGDFDLKSYIAGSIASITIPSDQTIIRGGAFEGCTNITSINLPDTLISIGRNAFYNCQNLTNVKCNGAISGFETGVFNCPSSASKLVTARFPYLTGTVNAAFGSSTTSNACKLLELVDCGNASKLGSNAFANCTALHILILRSNTLCTLDTINALAGTQFRGSSVTGGVVYVPSALISAYQTTGYWKTYYDDGDCTFSALENSPYANPDFVLS